MPVRRKAGWRGTAPHRATAPGEAVMDIVGELFPPISTSAPPALSTAAAPGRSARRRGRLTGWSSARRAPSRLIQVLGRIEHVLDTQSVLMLDIGAAR